MRKQIIEMIINAGLVVTLMFLAVAMAFAQTPAAYTNGKIAFTSDRDGNREIYVMDADGNEQVRLTNNSIVDDHPTWSPDGSKIAFLSQRASGAFAIFLMNADGSGKTEVTPITVPNNRNKIISWSPDGRQLAISQVNGIDIVDADGNNRRFLTVGFDPAWSPDGSKILFATPRISNSPGTLNTIRPDGTEPRGFLANLPWGSVTGYPDWSPDGSLIAVVGGDTANQDMFVIHSDSSGALFVFGECGGLLTQGSDLSPQGCGFINSLEWSPDGSKIVYGAFGILYVIDQYGNDRTVLAFTGANRNPSWQPLLSEVTISGKVTTPDGRGLRNATVTLTDLLGVQRTATTGSFGAFAFGGVPIGVTYVIGVSSSRYRFRTRSIEVTGNISGFDFVGLE